MNRKTSALFIFFTLALDAIGLGIVIPVLPDIVRRFLSDESEVSRAYGYFIAVYAGLQFLSSPLLGRLSDRYGRRPVLLIALFGAGVDYVFMALAPTLPLLFLGRVISGISGFTARSQKPCSQRATSSSTGM
jgi:DHA1 family tetracycline resistance protein-like MFS transporter